jgi:hypothetical protein
VRVNLGIGLACVAAFTACGGSDEQSSGPPQSPAGLWGFGATDPNLPVAIINSAGQAIFYTTDGEIFAGTAQVSGSDLKIAVEGYPDWGSTFSDGSSHGTGELIGTVTTGGSISASLTFTTDGGTPITADWTLPYYSFYEKSALAGISVVAGFSVAGGPASTLFIDPNGVMSSQTALDGCVLSGAVSTGDAEHNVYEVSYSYTDCSGPSQGLNGVQFTGLAFDSTNDVPGNLGPLKLMMVVTGASATASYGIVSRLIVAGF